MKTKILTLTAFLFSFLFSSVLAAEPADVNRDGIVDWVDICVVVGAAIFALPAANTDIDRNGIIDERDIVVIRDYPGFDLEKEFLSHAEAINYFFTRERFPGDINNNGIVNIVDLVLISKKYGQTCQKLEPEDMNDDRVVDRKDLDATIPLFGKKYFIFSQKSTPAGSKEKLFATFAQYVPFAVKPGNKKLSTWAALKKSD